MDLVVMNMVDLVVMIEYFVDLVGIDLMGLVVMVDLVVTMEYFVGMDLMDLVVMNMVDPVVVEILIHT